MQLHSCVKFKYICPAAILSAKPAASICVCNPHHVRRARVPPTRRRVWASNAVHEVMHMVHHDESTPMQSCVYVVVLAGTMSRSTAAHSMFITRS